MADDGWTDPLYPNRGETDDESAVSRRGLLTGTAVAGAALTAGCSSDSAGTTENGEPIEENTVFVFNTGDDTVSVIDADTDEIVGTQHLGLTASFPSNQFAPELTNAASDPLWLNVDQGVRALEAGTFAEVASVDTGSGANWQEATPDGEYLVVSAREPAHTLYRIDADPESESFGEVTAEIDRSDEGGSDDEGGGGGEGDGDNDGPGPCDVTIHPDGEYAYVPDIFGDTLTVASVDPFEIVTQISVDPVGDADAARPWMATAAWDGERLVVEHDEGETGTESVWDTSDPGNPEELARLTSDDGLGERPLTSEIGPDSETAYVFTPGSEDVTVVDVVEPSVTDRIPLEGEAFVGTWGPDREQLYVPVQTADEVAVVDHESGRVVERLSVGSKPYGATAARVRPVVDDSPSLRAAMSAVGLDVSKAGTTYCIGRCGCGHGLEGM